MLNAEEKDRLCRNIAGHLKNAAEFIQERAVSYHGIYYGHSIMCILYLRSKTSVRQILIMVLTLLSTSKSFRRSEGQCVIWLSNFWFITSGSIFATAK